MDRIVKKKNWSNKKILLVSLGVFVLLILIYQLVYANSGTKLRIEEKNVTFGNVKKEAFQEYVTQTGLVVPDRTYYLDAVEGGNIVQIFKESGAMVKKGDAILELENINLRLSVLSQENSLNEQINRVRTTRLQLDQNYLSQKQELALIENQLETVKPQYYRDSVLISKDLISQQIYEKTAADYKYNLKRKEFTFESFKNDSTSRLLQLKQLNSSEISMLENLKGVKKILDNLVIKAPIDGQLSTPKLQEGQNVDRGNRLGEVDIIGSYKVRVLIDEIYLSRINTGLSASADFAGKTYGLVISYIYPTIKDGSFEVDMDFVDDLPVGIKKGLSFRLRIELGKSSEQLVIPNGGFYNKSGGNWIFVVEKGNNGSAVRRSITLGRKNSLQYEVLEGLEIGEKVIISSYENFGDAQTLTW